MGEAINEISEEDVLVYTRYTKVAYNLQIANRTQLTYKAVTLTWIIATYIGIGYSPSSFEVDLPFNSLLVDTAICLASLLVLLAIWYLDLVVEEKRIAKTVHHGLVLEEKYSYLPRTYHNVAYMNYLFGYVSSKSIFYLSYASILILTACAALTAYLFINKYVFWWLVPFLTLICIPTLFFLANWITKKNDPYPLLNRIQHLEQMDYGNRE
jgi:hypothetical protein